MTFAVTKPQEREFGSWQIQCPVLDLTVPPTRYMVVFQVEYVHLVQTSYFTDHIFINYVDNLSVLMLINFILLRT
jgi:hypothetical protein